TRRPAIAGTPAPPAMPGTPTSSSARLIDVRRNLAIDDLAANVAFNGDQASITSLTGNLSTGGSLAIAGTVGIVPGSGFPADLTVTLTDATYVDGSLFAATADGTLTV